MVCPEYRHERTQTARSQLSMYAKKRKTSVDDRGVRLRKRQDHGRAYITLLNEDIIAANGLITEPEANTRHNHDVQNGLSDWSADERLASVHLLERHTVNSLQHVESTLPDKSVFEVNAYRGILKAHRSKHEREARHAMLVSHADVPAAAEISVKCCNAVNHAAHGVRSAVWAQDRVREEQRHGQYWLLTQEVADELEASIEQTDQGPVSESNPPEHIETSDSHVTPPNSLRDAIQLLDLSSMLHLSRTFYMIPNNGIDFTTRELLDETDPDEPSLLTTAFTDFHSLAIAVTKRLVAATIFQANSRIRATDDGRSTLATKVREQDVISATKILGITQNLPDYWLAAARRLNLNVTGPRRSGGLNPAKKPRLTYDEVESRLLRYRLPMRIRRLHDARVSSVSGQSEDGATTGGESDLEAEGDAIDTELAMNEAETDSTDDTDDDDAEEDDQDIKDEAAMKDDPTILLDGYLDDLDSRTSAREELYLWEAMKLQPPSETVDRANVELPPAPHVTRKTSDDLIDWRDRCDYQSPWERYGISYRDQLMPKLELNRSLGAEFNKGTPQLPTTPTDQRRSLDTPQTGAYQTLQPKRPSHGVTRRRVRERPSDNSDSADSADSNGDTNAENAPTPTDSPRRGRSRHRSGSPVSYRQHMGEALAVEDIISDSEDEYQPGLQ